MSYNPEYDPEFNLIVAINRFANYLFIAGIVFFIVAGFVFHYYMLGLAALFIALLIMSYFARYITFRAYLVHSVQIERLERRVDKMHSDLLNIKQEADLENSRI